MQTFGAVGSATRDKATTTGGTDASPPSAMSIGESCGADAVAEPAPAGGPGGRGPTWCARDRYGEVGAPPWTALVRACRRGPGGLRADREAVRPSGWSSPAPHLRWK